jgi:hypothetical protein
VLDLLAFQANVRNPVLSATVWAACHVELELLIELRQPLLKLVEASA